MSSQLSMTLLKKRWRETKDERSQRDNKQMSLRKSLSYAGISHNMWYYSKKSRNIPVDPLISKTVQEIGTARPTYGTRRMAAAISRELQTAINRKQVQRIFHKLGWIEPAKTKSEIIKSKQKLLKPTVPHQLWETDMTYIWCGIDRWSICLMQWMYLPESGVGYSFDVSATKDAAVQCVVNSVASEKPDCSKLVIRTDNGSQYISQIQRVNTNTWSKAGVHLPSHP